MHPILLDWRGVRIYSYPAMLYLGMVLGFIVGNYVANVAGLDSARVLVAMLVLTVVGLVGARLLHVLIHSRFYRRNPDQVWDRSRGGAAQLGGLLLILPTSIPLLHALEIPLARFWDVGIFTALIGMIFAKIGCALHGCCGGRPTEHWLALYSPNHCGVWCRRIPSQLLEAGVAGLLLLMAIGLWDRLPFPGAVFLAAAGVYAPARYALQGTREVQDRVGVVNVQKTLAIALGICALAGLLAGWLSIK
jgi:phosphatidylglycerol:prolipoprotein diacylglycerol transferase